MVDKYSNDELSVFDTFIEGKTDNDTFSVLENETSEAATEISDNDILTFEEEGGFPHDEHFNIIEEQLLEILNPPRIPIINIALNQSIKTASPVWTDISSYLQEVNTKRGRMHELDRIEAGVAHIVFDNSSGEFWRNNTGSSLYPYFKPITLIKFEFQYGTTVYPVFYGVIEEPTHKWQDQESANGPYVEVECVDFFKSLSRAYIFNANPVLTADASSGQKNVVVASVSYLYAGQSIKIYDDANSEVNTIDSINSSTLTVTMVNNLANTYHTGDNAKLKKFPQVLSGTRIQDVLLEWGLPTALMVLDSGQVEVIEHTPPADGGQSLEHIQKVAEAEDGIVFQARDGKITFQDSIARITSPLDTPQATFKDDGSDSKFSSPEIADEDEFIFNQARISGDGITTQEIVSSAAADQGQRLYRRDSSLIADSFIAFDQCYIIVARYTDSQLRPKSFLIKPAAAPEDLFAKALGFEISTKITLQLDSAINPAGINQDYHIEGMNQYWNKEDRVLLTTWQLWEVNKYRIVHGEHDGYLRNIEIMDYDTCHDELSASQPAWNDDLVISVGQQNLLGDFNIDRGMIQFDTTVIDPSKTIKSAEVAVWIIGGLAVDNAFSLCLVGATGVGQPLIQSDYGDLLSMITIFGTEVISTPITTDHWAFIVLNANGIAAVNRGGITRFGLRSSRDISKTSPGGGAMDTIKEYVKMAGSIGTNYPPRLIIRLD